MSFQTSRTAVPKLVATLSKKFPEQEIAYSWTDGDTRQHLGRMVFKGGEAIEVDIPQEPGALAQAMSAGVWRFQADAGQSPDHTREPQEKARSKGQDR